MYKEEEFFKEQTISSEIKAKIVTEYFPQYCKILLKKPQTSIRFLDLFAGPGKYEDQKHSTPLLLGKACAEDLILSQKVQFMFNDKKYSDELKNNFTNLLPEGTFTFEPRFGDKTVGKDDRIKSFLNKPVSKRNPNPTLLLFDPFGYKEIDTLTLSNFLSNWGNELFLFVNIKRLNQGITVKKFDEYMQLLFPTSIEQLRNDRRYTASPQERVNLIIDKLASEFVNAVSFKLYHCAFRFQEEDSNSTSHYIIHFSKDKKGYELVKSVYNAYDNIGASLEDENTYTFDAKKVNQAKGFDFGNQIIKDLSTKLAKEYAGQRITAQALYDEHQQKTKYTYSHYTTTLIFMIEQRKLESFFSDNVNHKQSVIISEQCILTFIP